MLLVKTVFNIRASFINSEYFNGFLDLLLCGGTCYKNTTKRKQFITQDSPLWVLNEMENITRKRDVRIAAWHPLRSLTSSVSIRIVQICQLSTI